MQFAVLIIYTKNFIQKIFSWNQSLHPSHHMGLGFHQWWEFHPTTQNIGLPQPHVPPLLCTKNVDFVISCKFCALCPNCPPTTSRPYLGNPVGSTLELKEHCLNKVYAICLKLFKQLFVVKSHPKIVQPLFIFFKKITPTVYFHNCL